MAYGQMILKSGFFHADPHPGNILICKGSEASQLLEFSVQVLNSSKIFIFVACHAVIFLTLLKMWYVEDDQDFSS